MADAAAASCCPGCCISPLPPALPSANFLLNHPHIVTFDSPHTSHLSMFIVISRSILNIITLCSIVKQMIFEDCGVPYFDKDLHLRLVKVI